MAFENEDDHPLIWRLSGTDIKPAKVIMYVIYTMRKKFLIKANCISHRNISNSTVTDIAHTAILSKHLDAVVTCVCMIHC